jgi:hypothetical protein
LPCQDAEEQAALELKKKRTFRKFTYRGIDLDNLLDLTPEQLVRAAATARPMESGTAQQTRRRRFPSAHTHAHTPNTVAAAATAAVRC